jgi:hypothetical protein
MGFRSSPEARSKADSAHNIRPPVLMTLYPIAPAGSGQVLSESVESGQPRLVGSGCATSSSATEPRKVIRRVLENTLAKAIGTSRNTPSLRVAGFQDSLSDEAPALYCRPLKSASQARRTPKPGRGRSRKDEDEAPCERSD